MTNIAWWLKTTNIKQWKPDPIIARDNKIKVVYIVAPFNESSYNKLNKNYIKQYNTLFESLKRKYPEVEFSSELFFYNNSFLGDPSHLNIKGRSKFSNELKSQLGL